MTMKTIIHIALLNTSQEKDLYRTGTTIIQTPTPWQQAYFEG